MKRDGRRGDGSTRPPARWSRAWSIVAACLVVVFGVLPLAIVGLAPGLDEEAFVCKVRLESQLAETMGGKLRFLLVSTLGGECPAERFVITIDHGYTAGDPDEVFWLQGSLMDRETYFGEHYLFFGRPQLYVSQVRSGALWPSQIERLGTLYAAPLTAVAGFYLVGAFPFMEEYSGVAWALVIARLLVLCAAVALAVLYRRSRRRWMPGLIWVVGGYLVVAVFLAVPSL